MSDPAALRPGPASWPRARLRLSPGWVVRCWLRWHRSGNRAVILGEPRRPEVKAGGHPVEAGRVGNGVPAAGGDPVRQGQDTGDELGRAEVAVPERARVHPLMERRCRQDGLVVDTD